MQTGPPCRGHKAGAQTLSAPYAWQLITLDTIDFDPEGAFNLNPYAYTCPTAGFYAVTAQVGVNTPATPSTFLLDIGVTQNGTTPKWALGEGYGGTTIVMGQDIVQCSKGDQLKLYAAVTQNVTLALASGYNYLAVQRVA